MSDEEFEQKVLQYHNQFRQKHKSPPLKLSEACRGVAQSWADSIAASGVMEHNVEQKDFGESIFKSKDPVDR